MILTDLVRSKLLAVDPSLTASGVALFSLATCKPIALGLISPPGPAMPMSERLAILQQSVSEMLSLCEVGSGDMLVCEGPAPLVLNPGSAVKVERVRGIFEAIARERQLSVPGRVNPRTVQTELLGMKGKQLMRPEVKLWARDTVKKLYGTQLRSLPLYLFSAGCDGTRKGDSVYSSGVDCRIASAGNQISQDVVDALLVGTLAVSRVTLSAKTGMSLDSAFESRSRCATKQNSRRGVTWRESDLAKLQKQ